MVEALGFEEVGAPRCGPLRVGLGRRSCLLRKAMGVRVAVDSLKDFIKVWASSLNMRVSRAASKSDRVALFHK